MASSSSRSVRFDTLMPCMSMLFFAGSMMVPTAVFDGCCSSSVFLSICCHSFLILTWFLLVSYSSMLVSDSSLERASSFCFEILECFESLLRLCHAPSSIRLRKWSSFGKADTV